MEPRVQIASSLLEVPTWVAHGPRTPAVDADLTPRVFADRTLPVEHEELAGSVCAGNMRSVPALASSGHTAQELEGQTVVRGAYLGLGVPTC